MGEHTNIITLRQTIRHDLDLKQNILKELFSWILSKLPTNLVCKRHKVIVWRVSTVVIIQVLVVILVFILWLR